MYVLVFLFFFESVINLYFSKNNQIKYLNYRTSSNLHAQTSMIHYFIFHIILLNVSFKSKKQGR